MKYQILVQGPQVFPSGVMSELTDEQVKAAMDLLKMICESGGHFSYTYELGDVFIPKEMVQKCVFILRRES